MKLTTFGNFLVTAAFLLGLTINLGSNSEFLDYSNNLGKNDKTADGDRTQKQRHNPYKTIFDSLEKSSPEPFLPNQPQFSGNFKMQFSVNEIVYKTSMEITNGSGTSLTTYFDTYDNRTKVVKQSMKVIPSAEGLLIQGSNPVNADNDQPVTDYYPDSFFFRVTPNRGREGVTCDTARQCSPVKFLN